MNISITGTADKRPIVYPLLYSMNFLGSTMLLTNDTIFRRLLPSVAEKGTVGNIFIDTSARSNPEIEKIYEFLKDEYEHSIIVTFEKTQIKSSEIAVLRDKETSSPEISFIRIGYSQPKEKEIFIQLNDTLQKQIYEVELSSRLIPFKSIINPVSKALAPIFEKKEKEMKKLLLYKGGKIT